MKKKFFVYVALMIFSIITTYVIYFNQLDFFQSMDDRIQDTKFRFRTKVSPSESIVMVEVDGKSIDKLGRWPWNRRTIADLITKTAKLGAKTIVLDMVFSENTDPKDDKSLANAISKAGNVILGYFFRNKIRKEESQTALERLPDFSIENITLVEDVKKLPLKEFKSAETNIDPINYLGLDKGFFSVFPDRDGILRRIFLVASFKGYIMPSLSLAAVSHYLNKKINLVLDRYGVLSLKVGDIDIPVSNTGGVLINYYGPSHSISHVSAVDILDGKVQKQKIKDKLVFLGVTEKAVGDLVPTPVDPYFPGTEVHCTVASNILQKFFLKRDFNVYLIDILTILLIPIIVGFISIFTRNTIFSLFVFLVFCGVYFYFNYFLFLKYNIRVASVYPLFEVIFTFILMESYRNIIIEQKSRYLKRAFSSYISKDLVNQLIKSPDKLKLGGERRNITVLFMDIRGFTSISENLSPENLVKLLNSLFGPLSEVILKNGGMLDKYIGDCMMALFNAPVELPNHPEVAVKSAVEIVNELGKLNDGFKEQGLPSIKVGIGINTGEVVVGNLGTKSRFDYTAVGDTVNLASRLEGINKYLGTTILISEFTYKDIDVSNYNIRYIGKVKVKGKKIPISVYEVLCDNVLGEQELELFEKGVKLFESGEIEESVEIFNHLYKQYDDPVSEYYLDKIKEDTHSSLLEFNKK